MRRMVWLLVLVGCAAFSGCDEESWWNQTPGLYNRRNHPLEARVRVARACNPGVDLQDPANYGPPVYRRLLARELVALRSLKSLRYDASLGRDDACTAIWLELPGLYEAVLSWPAWSGWDPDGDPYDHALVVEGTRQDVTVAVPAGMRELPPPEL